MRVASLSVIYYDGKAIIVSGKWIDGKKLQFTVRGPTRLLLPMSSNYLETSITLNGRKPMALIIRRVRKSEALEIIVRDAEVKKINPQRELWYVAQCRSNLLYHVRIYLDNQLLYEFLSVNLTIDDSIYDLLMQSEGSLILTA